MFMSIQLFNNDFLKRIFKEEKTIIEKNAGNYYVHAFLYRLMFLKYPQLEAVRFNEVIITVGLHHYKFYVEDKFELSYAGPRKLDELLLSSKYMTDDYRKMITNSWKGATKSFIIEMIVMKSFKTLNYLSFLGCIKMFFQDAAPTVALLFSIFFIAFLIIPSVVLRNLFKSFIKIRHKDWQNVWFGFVTLYSEMSKGSRRLPL